MKVKDLVDLKGCYSAHDVGEKEIDLSRFRKPDKRKIMSEGAIEEFRLKLYKYPIIRKGVGRSSDSKEFTVFNDATRKCEDTMFKYFEGLFNEFISNFRKPSVRLFGKERKIHEWEVSDERGWRWVELWEQDGELCLFAYDKDGGEVTPDV